MSAQDVADGLVGLRELLAKATPGPWKERGGSVYVPDEDDGDARIICGMGRSAGGFSEYYPVQAHKPEGIANAALIVAAVNALPSLLARIEALEAERAGLRDEMERRDNNETRNCLNWGPCSRHDGRMCDDDYARTAIRTDPGAGPGGGG